MPHSTMEELLDEGRLAAMSRNIFRDFSDDQSSWAWATQVRAVVQAKSALRCIVIVDLSMRTNRLSKITSIGQIVKT